MNTTGTKKVIRIPNDKYGCERTFYSIVEAAKWVKYNTRFRRASPKRISLCCYGKQNTAYGYRWIFT